mgnify:CR=1 FL=1
MGGEQLADRIKGITVVLGGDTTGLNKALSGTNKEIKSTQAQLKDVERLLKLDPTNTKLLEQRQRLLSEAVGETRSKLTALKEAEKQVQEQFKKGEISQQQYDALQREIIETESQLNKLESAANQSNAALNKIAAVANDISGGAQKVADATRGISVAAGGAAVGMLGMAVSAGAAADDINTLAKQSGFGTDEIQKWQYAADRMDVSVETIISSARKMKKNMVSTSKDTIAAWEELGVAVTDSNGELRDSTTVFYEAVDALAKVENETQRDTLAMQLFGKSADEMAGIIDDGGTALKEMGAEAEASGLILSQDALDGANAFNDGLDTLKAKAQQAFFSSGASLAENLLPMLDTLVEKMSVALSWIASLDGETLTMIGTVLLAVAAISPIAGIISKITGSIQLVTQAINFLIANPIVLLIAAIVALVVLIATKGDEIQAILQKVDNFLQNVFATDWTKIFGPVLGNILNGFFKNVKNIWDSIKRIFSGVIDFIRGVFTGDWERAWKGVQDIFGGLFNGLVALAKAPLNGIIGLLNMAIGAINSLINGFNSIGFTMPKWLGGGSWHPNIPNIPSIPFLAKGGTVLSGSAIVGEAGPELLTVGPGGTKVQPLTNSSTNDTYLGGLTLNVYGAPGQSENELANIIMEKIQSATLRKGAVFGA